MNKLITHITRRLAQLAKNESGAAMTEFVIGLPVFVMIFSGMGMLYRINNEALIVKAEANSALWADADLDMNAVGMVPIVGAASTLDSFDLTSIAQNGASGLGIYADSGVKTTVPLALVPGTFRSSPCYTVGCALANDSNSLFSRGLLNDNAVDGVVNGGMSFGNGPAALSSVLDATGSRPAIAAGLRYNTIEGEADDREVSTIWGDLTYQPGVLDMPATTVPTHRIFAVALTRAEFATDDIWDDQIPEFNSSFDLSSSSEEAGDECAAAMNSYSDCAEAGSEDTIEDRCGSAEDVAEDNNCGALGGEGAFGSVSCNFPGC